MAGGKVLDNLARTGPHRRLSRLSTVRAPKQGAISLRTCVAEADFVVANITKSGAHFQCHGDLHLVPAAGQCLPSTNGATIDQPQHRPNATSIDSPRTWRLFSVLSWIIAPALLTNACTLLVLSTANRLARAVDRAQELFRQLEGDVDLASSEAIRRLGELTATEQRSFMLLAALRTFYIACGTFASATLVSIFGAVIAPLGAGALVRVLEVCAAVAGLVAVSALIYGSVLLMRETRIVVQVLQERAASVRARVVPQGGHTA
jgi:hypothetical protein